MGFMEGWALPWVYQLLKAGALPNVDKGRATSRALFDMARETAPLLNNYIICWYVRCERDIVETADEIKPPAWQFPDLRK